MQGLTLADAQKKRQEIIREASKKIAAIQNGKALALRKLKLMQ